ERIARLHQVVISSSIETAQDVVLVVARGEQQTVHIGGFSTSTHFSAHVDAIQVGHDPIQYRQTNRGISLQGSQGSSSVFRTDDFVFPTSQPVLQHCSGDRFVVSE